MKTVLISSFHAVISRNILQTGFLDMVSKRHLVILLVPEYKKEYFSKQFASENVIVEGVFTELSRGDIFWRKAALAISPTRTLTIKKQSDYFENGHLLRYLAGISVAFIFGKVKPLFRFVQWMDACTGVPTVFAPLFEKYNPDLVFTTDTQHEMDVRLLQEAHVRKVPTVGMIRSWDNLTAKGAVRCLPRLMVVNNETLADKAVRYNWMPKDQIRIVGIPHYDEYARVLPNDEKDRFFESFGFEKERKTVMYAPFGNRFVRNNRLDQMVVDELASNEINLLIRFHPNDEVALSEDFSGAKAIVHIDRPGVRTWSGGRKTNEIGKENDRELQAQIQISDVVVAGPSTVLLDSTVFNKPAIAIDFDDSSRSYPDSVNRYYDYDHLQALMAPGAIYRARSLFELRSILEQKLENPSVDEVGRARIIREQCYRIDGQSTARLADLLLSEIEKKP